MSIAVAILSDVRVYRQGLADAMRVDRRIKVVAATANVGELEGLDQACRAVVLLDATMPNALAVLRDVKRTRPHLNVVVFAVSDDETEALRWVEAGASEFVPREASMDRLLSVIDGVSRGELLCSARLAARMADRLASLAAATRLVPVQVLTVREHEILRLLATGCTNKDIARVLCISVSTTKTHVHHILEKLKLRRRAEAGAWLGRSVEGESLAVRLSQ